MNQNSLLALKKLSSSLEIDRKIVGIKFLFDNISYENANAKPATNKIPYCVMVKLATDGFAIKATLETSGCSGGTRALGLEATTSAFKSGCEYNSFGIYKDLAISKNVVNNITFCNHKIYGVVVKPLELYEDEPDVVITITNSYNTMRIIQGYTYRFGTQTSFKLAGNQAVCSECTAYPFETNSINISMFCAGTRYLAGWKNDEIAIGLPYGKFLDTCDGVFESINGAENNKNKKLILNKISKNNLEDPGIKMDDAYFIRLAKK